MKVKSTRLTRYGLQIGVWLLLFFLAACGSAGAEEGAEETIPTPTIPDATPIEEGTMFYDTMSLADGTELRYAVVLPAGFTPQQSWPILLALPPGPQTEAMVEAGLSGYWEQAAQERGWIVISPEAPNGELFFRGSEAGIPEFLDRIEEMYRPENGRFHIAGISNGGISAFRIASNNPERFQSMLVAPGLPTNEDDFNNLDKLTELPISMFVGENDTGWIPRMEETEARLSELGAEVSLEVVPDEGHVIQSLRGGERLFDFFESHRWHR